MAERITGKNYRALEGLKSLERWHNGEDVLTSSTEILSRRQDVTFISRGEQKKSQMSVLEFMEDSLVYQWFTRDEKGVYRAIRKDPQLLNALLTLTDLTEYLRGSEEDTRIVLGTLALTENLAQISDLSSDHTPRFIANLEDLDLNEGQTKDEEGPFEKNPSSRPFRNLLRRTLSHLDLNPALPKTRRESSDELMTRLKRERQHPYFSTHTTAGRERVFSDFNNNQRALDYLPNGHRDETETFIAVHTYDSYDPEKGILERTGERALYEAGATRRFWDKSTLRIPLGRIPAALNLITIPQPISDIAHIRGSYNTTTHPKVLEEVLFYNTGDEILTTEYDTSGALVQDNFGNISFDMGLILPDVRQRLLSSEIAVEATFGDSSIFSEKKIEKTSMGPFTKNDPSRLHLYPPEIQSLIYGMLTKKENMREKSWHVSQNQEIFQTLASYLGNVYLTYHKLDARRLPTDAIGYNQTERVLNGRVASCEGANIALGQLMRFFLKDGESIGYVSGFILDVDGKDMTATADNYHMKVMYIDELGGTHYFDATPWSLGTKKEIKQRYVGYKKMRNEWRSYKDDLKSRYPDLYKHDLDEIRNLWHSISNIWMGEDVLIGEYYKKKGNLNREKLPGELDNGNGIIRNSTTSDGRETIELDEFLLEELGIDKSLLPAWSTGFLPISAYAYLSLRATEKLIWLHARSTSPDTYLKTQGSTDKLLSDKKIRNAHFKEMEAFWEKGHLATEQNIKTIETFSSVIKSIREVYLAEFTKIFQQYQVSISGEISDFIHGAPFFLLLRNPIHSLNGFFQRSKSRDTLGFLVHEGSGTFQEEIRKNVMLSMNLNNITMEMIVSLMENAPKTTSQQIAEIQVPSTRFWKNEKEEIAKEIPEDTQTHFNPIDVFIYLANEIYR